MNKETKKVVFKNIQVPQLEVDDRFDINKIETYKSMLSIQSESHDFCITYARKRRVERNGIGEDSYYPEVKVCLDKNDLEPIYGTITDIKQYKEDDNSESLSITYETDTTIYEFVFNSKFRILTFVIEQLIGHFKPSLSHKEGSNDESTFVPNYSVYVTKMKIKKEGNNTYIIKGNYDLTDKEITITFSWFDICPFYTVEIFVDDIKVHTRFLVASKTSGGDKVNYQRDNYSILEFGITKPLPLVLVLSDDLPIDKNFHTNICEEHKQLLEEILSRFEYDWVNGTPMWQTN